MYININIRCVLKLQTENPPLIVFLFNLLFEIIYFLKLLDCFCYCFREVLFKNIQDIHTFKMSPLSNVCLNGTTLIVILFIHILSISCLLIVLNYLHRLYIRYFFSWSMQCGTSSVEKNVSSTKEPINQLMYIYKIAINMKY